MKRIRVIDYLKTFAIIGILLFHVGAIKNGYLGVEVFFVISGFLMMKSIVKSIQEHEFRPLRYVSKRIGSFWPLIVVTGIFSLAIGFFTMLPDDYENLAESVIASNLFSNNILQAITTKNYWDIVNTYKPLMHTWYIGVLFQSIVFLSILFWIVSKVSKKNALRNMLIIVSAVSLAAYCLPVFSDAQKFYFFPFRLFEITLGSLTLFIPKEKNHPKTMRLLSIVVVLMLLFMLFAPIRLPESVCLLIVVLFSCIAVWSGSIPDGENRFNEKVYNVITAPGRYSYDVYIWHQVVIAFLYYSVFQAINLWLVCLVITMTAVLSFFSIMARKRCGILQGTKKRILVAAVLMMIGCVIAGFVYLKAGVVRDIPELGVEKTNVHRNMHAEYVDIPYAWDADFSDDEKIHVLVMGNSFGRDIANILHESEIADRIEISYLYGADATGEEDRIAEADYVIFGMSSWDVPDELKWISDEKLYIAGSKTFGNSNGIIYAHRNRDGYYDQRVEVPEDTILRNNALKETYGDHYIDMITPLIDEENRIRVFSDDGFYISQDCRHLTKYGAKYYARILDLSFIQQ